MNLFELTKAYTLKQLLGSGFIYHAVRNDADLESIFKHGLAAGTNVSFDPKGQAFEDEGATILVFDRTTYLVKNKSYQHDGTVSSGSGKPVAILKDTGLEAKKGIKGDDIVAEYEKLQDNYELLASRYGLDADQLKRKVMKNDPSGIRGTDFKQAQRYDRREDEIFKLLDQLGDKDEIKDIHPDEVLKKYKAFKVPVFKLPK